MTRQYFYVFTLLLLSLAACGESVKKGKDVEPSNNTTANNTANNASTNNSSNNAATNNTSPNNNVSTLTCGDGVVDAAEKCDSGIGTGAGSCPNACPPQGACTLGTLSGNAATCSAQCEYSVVTSCVDNDGCCPANCDYLSDSDCSPTCNNGVIDAGETCDGNCPTSCGDNNACTTDTLTGSAANCSAQCANVPVTACTSGDGCCPAGCTAATDSDCTPVCGNQVVEGTEVCDGNCPASCNDNMACTADSVSGSAAQCNLRCTNTPINACQSGDGCCPVGCTYAVDQDCACQPLVCGAAGRQCGAPANGCGGNLNCGTCQSGFTCSNFNCVATGGPTATGSACTAQTSCAGAIAPFCVSNPNFKDGYCSSQCQFDNDCPSGSHCDQKNTSGTGSCLKNCASNTDCRPGYLCYDGDGDGMGSKECLPAGTGSGTVGATCGGVYDCAGGTNGICHLASDGWPGGYCSETCTAILGIGFCPTGSTCHGGGLLGTDEGSCQKDCTTSAQCRSGYTCQTFTTILTGTTYKVCN